jgi:hypothetical protein
MRCPVMSLLALLAVGSCPPAVAQRASAEGDRSWVDTSYEYVTNRADTLSQQFDSFFGEADAERESADSVLRLQSEYEWNEQEQSDARIRLRGKVDLPQLNRRLSLVFGEENDYRNDVLPSTEEQDGDVGLQYSLLDRARSRLDLSFGTNASLDFHTSLRYRYLQPVNDRLSLRFTERLYLKEGDGTGSITRGDIDYSFSTDRILRFTSDVEYGQETDGAEWGSRLSYLLKISPRAALSYFVAVSGQTEPRHITDAYAIGIRYRRNVLRPWIFVEVEPSHLWRRETEDDRREPAWAISFRLELLEELRNRHHER